MKKINSLLVALLIVCSALAQTSKIAPPTITQADRTTLEQMNKKDCVFMQNGKMLMMKGGKTMDMPNDITLSNGDVVSTNGSVKMKNGETKMIKNGDSVDMNGVWERMDKNKR